MKTVWTIASHTLRIMAKDKTSLIWMLIVPCLYILVFGSAFRHQSDPRQSRANLSVFNMDEGTLSGRLMNSLESENLNLTILDSLPEAPPLRLLTIPATFSERLKKGKRDTLMFKSQSDANVEAGLTAELAVRKAAYRLLADMVELKSRLLGFSQNGLEDLDARERLIRLETSYAGKHIIIPSGFTAQVPAQIVQFTLLILFIFSGSMLFEEKKNGLLRRTRVAPVSFLQLYLGKLAGAILVGLTQMTVLLLVGRFAFGVFYGNSLPGLVLLAITFATAVGAMGLILGFLVRNGEKLVGIAIISALAMSAFSGCWWPVEVTPAWMQNLALFLPSGLALKAFHRLISYGDGFRQVLPYILGEAGFAVVFSLIFALILVRYKKSEQLV